ncbi:MAG: SurA N-terminal domain-containing protein [Candidatus Adiutrix sp.]|nr:SurA N-terminal domain-containing protein [Candidatus Adiutrix sp.]
MRKNANSTIVWLIIGAIAVVFVFFGVGGGGGGNYQNITVNGEELSGYQYSRMVNDISRARGQDNSPEAEAMIRQAAVAELVGQTLILQFGRSAGLEPSNWAVGQEIAGIPEFQTDGKFDKARYATALAAMRQTPANFEQETRKGLLASRVSGLIEGLSRVYSPEFKEMYHFFVDKAAFDYVFFPASVHRAGLNPSDDEVAAFFAVNQERWRRPAVMKVAYVDISPADYLDQAQVSDDELREIYKENSAGYDSPASAEVSHILLKFPRMNPDQEEREQTRKRAEEAYQRAAAGDFAALARELSDDQATAAEGGSLGTITRGMTFENLETAAFEAPLGQVTQPVATDIGYHLLKVTARREAGLKTFDEVKDALRAEQKAVRAKQAAIDALEDLLTRLETNPQLADAAASMGLTVKTSDSFTADQPPDFFEGDAAEVTKAFGTPLGQVAAPLEKDDHLVVFVPVEKEESRLPALAEVREEAALAWIAAEADRRAQAEASSFIKKASETGWEEAVRAWPPESMIIQGHSDLAARNELAGTPAFARANQSELYAAGSSVTRPGQISPLTVSGEEAGGSGSLALRLAEIQPADEAAPDDQAGNIIRTITTMNKGNLMYQVWRSGLYEASRANIVVPPEYLN